MTAQHVTHTTDSSQLAMLSCLLDVWQFSLSPFPETQSRKEKNEELLDLLYEVVYRCLLALSVVGSKLCR